LAQASRAVFLPAELVVDCNPQVMAGFAIASSGHPLVMTETPTRSPVSPKTPELPLKAVATPESLKLPMKVLRWDSINCITEKGLSGSSKSMDIPALESTDALEESFVGAASQAVVNDGGSGADRSSIDVLVGDTLDTSKARLASGAHNDASTGFPVPPGLRPPPGTPSHGSVLHAVGGCHPCVFFWKPGGCKNGAECSHCHSCPEGEIKERKRAKWALMRLGLVTPKQRKATLPAVTFSLEENLFGVPPTFEHDSESTGTGPSELELASSGSVSDLGTGRHSESQEAEVAPVTNEEPGDHERIGFSLPLGILNCSAALTAGSALHGTGMCQPCAWFHKPNGCRNGVECNYCHLCPDGEVKIRKKQKHVMMRLGLVTPTAVVEKENKCILNLADCL